MLFNIHGIALAFKHCTFAVACKYLSSCESKASNNSKLTLKMFKVRVWFVTLVESFLSLALIFNLVDVFVYFANAQHCLENNK